MIHLIFSFLLGLLFISSAQASNNLVENTNPSTVQDTISNSENASLKLKGLDEDIFLLALRAHNKAAKQGLISNPFLVVVNYSLPSTEKRLWIFDLSKQKVIHKDYVAHGRNQNGDQTLMAEYFSNIPESLASSLGTYVTTQTYLGKHGLSLRLKGLEKDFNTNAEKRAIVMHGAPYVSKNVIRKTGKLGCSFGCLAVRPSVKKKLFTKLKEGSLVFAYYPDSKWLKKSSYIN